MLGAHASCHHDYRGPHGVRWLSGPTAENLNARAETIGAALADGNIPTTYEFPSPESKSVWSQEEYLAAVKPGLMSEAASMGLDKDGSG